MIRNLQIAGQGRLKLLGPNLWMAAPYGCLWLGPYGWAQQVPGLRHIDSFSQANRVDCNMWMSICKGIDLTMWPFGRCLVRAWHLLTNCINV